MRTPRATYNFVTADEPLDWYDAHRDTIDMIVLTLAFYFGGILNHLP